MEILIKMLTNFKFFTIYFLNLLIFIQSVSSSNLLIKQPHLIKTGFTNILWEYIDSNNFKTNWEVSKTCKLSLNHVNQSLSDGQTWPIQLFESSGKIPDDFTGAGYLALGDFDKCQQLTWTNYNGNNQQSSYCVASFLPNNQLNDVYTEQKIISCDHGFCFKIAFCLPSDCSSNDLQIVASNALKHYGWNLIRVDHCSTYQTYSDKLIKSSTTEKVCLLLTLILVSIVFMANFLEYKSTTINNNVNEVPTSNWTKYFSFKSSYQQIVDPNVSSTKMLNLLQYSTMLHVFVLLKHVVVWPLLVLNMPLATVSWGNLIELDKALYFKVLLVDWYYEGIFTYGGFARTLSTWRQIRPEKSLFQIIKSTLFKLLTLSSLITTTLIIHITAMFFASGPLEIASKSTNSCIKSFWPISMVLYNGYAKGFNDHCLAHFWSVSAESQALPIIVLLVFLYKRYPKIGLACNLIALIASFYYIGWAFYAYQYPAHSYLIGLTNLVSLENYLINIYQRAPPHLWMYFSTVFFAYLSINDYVPMLKKLPILKQLSGNMFLFGFCITLSQILYPYLIEPYESRMVLVIYSIVHRLVVFIFFLVCSFSIVDETKSQVSEDKESDFINGQDKSVDSLEKISKYKFYMKIATILRSTYFIHITIITILLNNLRKPLTTQIELQLFNGIQIICCLLGGLLFHFFVLGPMTNIMTSGKTKPKIN